VFDPQTERSLIDLGIPETTQRSRGLNVVVLLFVRVLTGVAALVVGVLNLRGHAAVALHAKDWGLPAPSLLTWIGVASRFSAFVVLVVALVIVATAGRVEGGAPLIGGALLAVGCLIIVARGGGAAQLLDRIDPVL
jgi:hypothetical protein